MSWRIVHEFDPVSRDKILLRDTRYYFNHRVPIVLQQGPTCGIAALLSILLVDTPDINTTSTAQQLLSWCKRRGISKQGELMSPLYMAELANWINLRHQVVRVMNDENGRELITEMLRDSVIMIIYDKDMNNEPTTRYQGQKAHWVLITGFCYKNIKSRGAKLAIGPGTSDNSHSNSYSQSKAHPEGELHVFVQHGKSAHRQLWPWADLLASNMSVRVAKAGDYVVPDDLNKHVAGHVVRVQMPGSCLTANEEATLVSRDQ